VRNSGATAVIEGCGANGCEYMTGGTVVILGPVGFNFAAGMTGGMAFVHDAEDRLRLSLNADSVVVCRVGSAHWQAVLRALVEEHAAETGSGLAADLLRNWDAAVGQFWQVCPKEMVGRLDHPLEAEERVPERASLP
jgi:glutamate synthase (NADPH/NADH) large chain